MGACAEPTTSSPCTRSAPGRALGHEHADPLDPLDLLGPHDPFERLDVLEPTAAARPMVASALKRAAQPGYGRWLAHVKHAGACTSPIRLRGYLHAIDPATGAIAATTSTLTLPDGVVYTACGNRRASVCPSCAELYRADTYQLIKAGLTGGKNVPASVTAHPVVFLTATAPSFGPVHSTRAGRDGVPRPCRPRRTADTCEHGRTLACTRRHEHGDPWLGQPFCLDCYDHLGQAVWNAYTGELWRRTLLRVNKTLRAYGARASFAKVAEMQARGVVHLHALIRLDALEPALVGDTSADGADGRVTAREVPVPPPPSVGMPQLRQALEAAFEATAYTTPPHPSRASGRSGWTVAWGKQLDIRPVRDPDLTRRPGALTEGQVAAYLAKYATKATEATGHTSARLTPQTAAELTARGDHIGRLVDACWTLGHPAADNHAEAATGRPVPDRLRYGRLRRWAHMLGFGGHFSTKSRRYSTTLGALRRVRIDWRDAARRRRERLDGREVHIADTTLLVGALTYAGTGWHTSGDALLANTAAAQAREHARASREHAQEPDQLHDLNDRYAANQHDERN